MPRRVPRRALVRHERVLPPPPLLLLLLPLPLRPLRPRRRALPLRAVADVVAAAAMRIALVAVALLAAVEVGERDLFHN